MRLNSWRRLEGGKKSRSSEKVLQEKRVVRYASVLKKSSRGLAGLRGGKKKNDKNHLPLESGTRVEGKSARDRLRRGRESKKKGIRPLALRKEKNKEPAAFTQGGRRREGGRAGSGRNDSVLKCTGKKDAWPLCSIPQGFMTEKEKKRKASRLRRKRRCGTIPREGKKRKPNPVWASFGRPKKKIPPQAGLQEALRDVRRATPEKDASKNRRRGVYVPGASNKEGRHFVIHFQSIAE